MTFFTFLGQSDYVSTLGRVLREHAAWAGLHVTCRDLGLVEGMQLQFGWLTKDHLVLPSLKADPLSDCIHICPNRPMFSVCEYESGTIEKPDDNWIHTPTRSIVQLSISVKRGTIKVSVPWCSPEQLCYSHDTRGYVLTNDMRLLLGWAGMEIDDRAVYSLFQYGIIPPTMTISRTIDRVPCGHTFEISARSDRLVARPFARQSGYMREAKEMPCAQERVLSELRRVVGEIPRDSILYFSGGVDSSLLAACLADAGRKDVTLVNYAFSPNDREADIASEIAAHLGLPYERVLHRDSAMVQVLDQLGEDYTYPFSDRCTVPTNLLVRSSLQAHEGCPAAVDGTGADGAFGLGLDYLKWSNVYKMPLWIRLLVSSIHRRLELWSRYNRLAQISCGIRRSTQMPIELGAGLARASLDGIAYNMLPSISRSIDSAFADHFRTLADDLSPTDRFCVADLVYACAGRMAAKSFDPLRRRGTAAIYPFLEPRMIELSLSLTWGQKCEKHDKKALLKDLLASRVPARLVYRPKGHFALAFGALLGSPHLAPVCYDIVMSNDNPLLDYVNRQIVDRMFHYMGKGRSMSRGVYNFLWTIVFTSAWLRQIRNRCSGYSA